MKYIALLMLLMPVSPNVFALCGGPLNNNAFNRAQDYNNPRDAARIKKVEEYHFNTDVETLVRGNSSSIPQDLDYTLRQIPNHYRALDAMARWQIRHPRPPGTTTHFDIECYFERAFAFKPRESTLFLVYGVHLHRNKKLKEALKAYETVLLLEPNSAEAHYNMGLLYIELQNLEKAHYHAKQAYSLGHTLPGLRNKLKKLKAWNS